MRNPRGDDAAECCATRVEQAALVDCVTDHRRQFTHHTIRHLSGRRDLAVAFEFGDRGLGVGADRAGRLELAVAVFGERTLHRCDTARTARTRIGGSRIDAGGRGIAEVDTGATPVVAGATLSGATLAVAGAALVAFTRLVRGSVTRKSEASRSEALGSLALGSIAFGSTGAASDLIASAGRGRGKGLTGTAIPAPAVSRPNRTSATDEGPTAGTARW